MKNLGQGKKAEMGIGTLIIFIAMILVAAIAAGVLLQTASSLQNKALLTGEKSKTQVSTTLTPILAYGEDASSDQTLEYFFIKAKLAPGSDPIKLDEMLIEFDLINDSADLTYSTGSCVASPTAGYATDPGTNSGNYTVRYLIQGDSYVDNYLQRGDVIEICLEAPRAVQEDEDISIHLIPKVGTSAEVQTSTPDIMTDAKIVIYP